MKNHRRENKALRVLVKCAVILAVALAGIIIFTLFIEGRGQKSQPVKQTRQKEAAPLVIETPEPETQGSIRVFDYDGCCIYAYYGEIKINGDGRDGKEIDIECAGYLEGYQQHGEPAYKEESEVGNE